MTRDLRPPRAPALVLAALFGVSASLLLVEVALTKIFSIVLWYHFGFLVISIALLGFAASGVWLARRARSLDGEEGARVADGLCAKLAGGASLATAASLWLVVHTNVDAMTVLEDRDEGGLFFQIAVLLVPFFLLGATISATITRWRARAGTVYAANLIGSGVGCALAIVLFDGLRWSAPDAVLFGALLMALGGLGYAVVARGRGAATPIVAAVLVAAAFASEGREEALHLAAPTSKPLWHVEEWERNHGAQQVDLASGETLVFTEWRYLPETGEVVFDLLTQGKRRVPFSEVVTGEDGRADLRPFDLVRFTEWSSLSRVDAFHWPPNQPPWGLWGLSPRFEGDVPAQVGITIDSWAMTNILRWEGGDAPTPEVLDYLPAGLVHRIRSGGDVLCIGAGGGMDLLTAKRFGASSITGVEINASVVRAAREVFPDFQGGLYDPEREPDVRVEVAEGRHFLERDDRRYDVVQLSGVDTASTTQAGAFNLSENFLYTVEAFETYLERTKEDGIVTLTRWFLPDREGHPRNTLRLFVLAWRALERAGIDDPGRHVYLAESQGFSVILFGRRPFTSEELARLDATCEELSVRDPAGGFVSGLRTLYHPERDPVYAVPATVEDPLPNPFEAFAAAGDKDAWLAAYPYDVGAPTDDRPFFFETSRFRHLLERDSFFNPLGGITAHGILAVLLALLAGAAWAFVIAPLRRVSRAREGDASPLPVLLYFGALGLGFILVEVVLSQKFILFLGSPLYSLSVVLFSVLVFSGIGSALSGRVGSPRTAIVGIVAIAAVYPLALDPVFDAALALSTPARIGISVALLAPLSLLLGMPFPLGVARIAPADPAWTAWAWGINGYTSVVGSVLTVVLSIAVGFDKVVWIGGAVYLVAFAAAPALGRLSAPASSS